MILSRNPIFPILTLDKTHGIETLLGMVPHLDPGGLTRLQQTLGAECKGVVVEHHYIDKDYRNTFSHFHSKRFATPDPRCVRLHFFSAPVTEQDIVGGVAQEHYLGYSIIRPTKPNCVGRTLISYRLAAQECHLCICTERVHLMGVGFEIQGFPFISQDADVTVCAESSLWMLFRYFSNRYAHYSEILPFEITDLASNHAIGGRVCPSEGLYSQQLAEAIRLRGFSPVTYSRNQFAETFEHLAYTYIESGIPLLMSSRTHVFVCMGHQSGFQRNFAPSGDILSQACYTSWFNEFFVVNDDTRRPYGILSDQDWPSVEEIIVPLPERVFLKAEEAQVVIEDVLSRELPQSPTLKNEELVLRLFLTTSTAFKAKLGRGMGNAEVEHFYRSMPMPHFIWICEISLFDEYRNHFNVYGEILWDATRNALELDGWLVLHFPEILVFDASSALNLPPYEPFRKKLSGSTKYELFRSNLTNPRPSFP